MKINEDKYFHFKMLTAIGVVSTINLLLFRIRFGCLLGEHKGSNE